MQASTGQDVDSTGRLLDAINDSTKWAVSGTVAAVLLYYHNAECAWCVLGSIVCSFLGKALKYILNQQRPESARKADPGMPSSHATSLAFLSTYAATAVTMYWGSDSAASLAAATAIVSLALFLAWLRVARGYHTSEQVLVGLLLGSVVASAWLHYGAAAALPVVASSAAASGALWGATGCAVAAFTWKNVTSWWSHRA